ncbi:hypothetical protein LTI14_04370 [Nesterenkonia sp. YGD6]|uniref:hypothetical protein n=1 Tax=Nesterenkonia sp. YGD6 TaxID=2901231 RepID=UPI001F4D317D|nr:hypothetical protein [Nesterenkonia sp. YGD6]MCH8562457.1 hypothetical protein [Nesterenkonia sp. YGD6]
MNRERDDERAAKVILEEAMGFELEHADTNGGVDYISTDGIHAVEVTRVTDGERRAAWGAFRKSPAAETSHRGLNTCWVAFVSDTHPNVKGLRQKLHSWLVDLELAGQQDFDRNAATRHVIELGPLSHVYRPLLAAEIERASAVPHPVHREAHDHRVYLTLGSGGSSSGSDEALVLLGETLSEKTDNPKKLQESGAQRRHLFVWLDDATRSDIARPLSRDAPSWDISDYGLPSQAPDLDPAVTDLWVVHEGSRLGWGWNGETWRELRGS